MDESALDIGVRLLVVVALVLLNGFFVASEFAIVTVRRTRVAQLVAEGHPLAKALHRAAHNPNPYLAAAQAGITMASLALGWIGAPAIAALIEPMLHALPEPLAAVGAYAIAVAIAFTLITALHITIGEQVPKSLAIQRSEAVGLAVAKPTELFLRALWPFIVALNAVSNGVLRLVGAHRVEGHALVHTVEELKLVIEASRRAGVLDPRSEEIIEKVFDFDDLRAHQIMVPRTEIVAVPKDCSLPRLLAIATRTRRSRIPVYDGTIDNIVGVVHVKDLLPSLGVRGQPPGQAVPAVQQVMREALVLPEGVLVSDLLPAMRLHKSHLAILVDEYGGTAGLVTADDVIRRLIGDMGDEFSEIRVELQRFPDGSVLVDGLVGIPEVNDELGLDLADENYDTIGGFVLGQLGRLPVVGDEVSWSETRLRVEEMDGHRIARVRIVPPLPPVAPSETPATEPA